MEKFKGTPKPWHVLYYNNSLFVQDGKLFRDNNLLDISVVGKEKAKANAQLMSKALELLEAMQEFCDRVDKGEVRSTKTYNKFKELIQEATT